MRYYLSWCVLVNILGERKNFTREKYYLCRFNIIKLVLSSPHFVEKVLLVLSL